MKNRYFLEIAFNGTRFHGWQIQKNQISVQGEITRHISILLNEKVTCHGCGRTDAGVHAKKYMMHFDSTAKLNGSFGRKLNSFLPNDISIKKMYANDKRRIHARFDALSRSYEYVLSKGKNPFLQDMATLVFEKYDINLMNEACNILMEYKDFEAFSKGHNSHNHYLCDLHEANWEENDETIIFKIKSNRFVRSMIRMLTGTMIQVGRNQISLEQFRKIIESKDRTKSGKAMAAHGLYFMDVEYPEGVFVELS